MDELDETHAPLPAPEVVATERRPPVWLVLLIAGCVGVLYLLPQLLYVLDDGQGALYWRVDEPSYAARLTRVTQGYLGVGNQWTYEGRGEPSLIPALPELTLGSASLLGLEVDHIVVCSRLLLPTLGFLAFYSALAALGFGRWFALFSAAWIFTDPGLTQYKPLLHLVSGHPGPLPFNRFSNPMFALPLFFLSWRFAGLAYTRLEHAWRDAAIAGASLGLLFYVSVYYWSHLTLAFALAALTLQSPQRWRVLGLGAATALLVSLPYWGTVLELRRHPVYPLVAWRNGLLIPDRGWYLLPHKTLWLFVAAALLLLVLRRQDPQRRYLLCGVFAGLACYFSPLFTGVSFQNFHWSYTLAPLLYVAVLDLLRLRVPARWPRAAASRWVWVGCWVLLAVSACTSLVSSVRWYVHVTRSRTYTMGLVDHAYGEAWKWLRAHASPDDVVLASPTTMPLVPARTGLRVWSDSIVELVPDEEVLARNQVLWALEGVSAGALRERLTPEGPLPVPQWRYGMPTSAQARLIARGKPPIDEQVCGRLAEEVARLQAELGDEDVISLGSGRRLDYLLRGPHEPPWTRAEELLVLEPVGLFGEVRIDRVRGWRSR